MKTVQLKEIVTQIRGVSYSKGDAVSNEIMGYIPLIRANNIVDGILTKDDLLYVPASIVKEKQLIKKGDIVIAASSGSINIVGKAAYSPENLNSTFGAFCKLLRPNAKHVLPGYLNFYFQSNAYRKKISSLAQGANINNLKNEHIDELEILLPPLSEQKRIAEILDKADALRQKNKQLLATYDELLQATFLDMFGDPVTNLKGWEKKLIKEIGSVVTGNTPPRANPENYGNYIEWIKTDNISTEIIYPTNSREFLSEFGMKKGRVVPVGSILVTCIAGSLSSIGNCVITNREVAFNQQINAIIPKKCNSYFLYSVMQYSKKVTQDAATKGMKKLLIKSNFEKLTIICPPITLQNQFAQIVENIEAQKALVKQSLQESEDLFNGLVQKAFGGEL